MKNDPRLEQLIECHELAREYPAEVHAEAAAFVEAPGFDDPSLEDLELLPFVTIDDEDSRDLDQALCLARGDTGGFEVWYALADASHFVPRASSKRWSDPGSSWCARRWRRSPAATSTSTPVRSPTKRSSSPWPPSTSSNGPE
ncbi:MAG: RNB domain-containing ribonuclease [Acidobacteria bacterium]|nr:RNB domain-containing ribonuclease [Acidobacteriota bacterium]